MWQCSLRKKDVSATSALYLEEGASTASGGVDVADAERAKRTSGGVRRAARAALADAGARLASVPA